MYQGVKYGIKLGLIGLTVGLSAFVYKAIYWEPELKDQGHMLFNVLEFEWHNDALYIGESSNYWTSPNDSDKRSISEMINAQLAHGRLSGTQVPAYHAGMFLPVIRQIDPNSRVKHLVVTMNLRSFGQAWIYSSQEAALMRSKCFYGDQHPLFNRMAAALGYYEQPSASEQDAKMLAAFEHDRIQSQVALPYMTINTWKDHIVYDDPAKQALAHHYVKAYAFSIDTLNNPRIADFDEMVNVCRSKGIRLYFNIMSENTAWADSLVGPALSGLMRENVAKLVKRYASKGVVMIDNLSLVPAACFGEKDWTTEHYDQSGRQIIAQQVATILNRYVH